MAEEQDPEVRPLDYWRSQREYVIKGLGTNALSNVEIDDFGKKHLKGEWGGVTTQDNLKIEPSKYYIVNTAYKNGRGSHWVGVATGKTGTVYIFDSFGRPLAHLLPTLIRQIENKGLKWIATAPRVLQREDSKLCGQISLAWLLTVEHYGIKKAMFV